MKKLLALRKSKKGFTLVEIIIVLVIIAILAAVAIPTMSGYISKANATQTLTEARAVYLAIQSQAAIELAKGTVDASKIDADEINGWIGVTGEDKYVKVIKDSDFSTGTDGDLYFTIDANGKVTALTFSNHGKTVYYTTANGFSTDTHTVGTT